MLVLDGFLEMRRERRLVENEIRDDTVLVGRSLRGPIADVWRERGMQRALELIADVNAEEDSVSVRWVWLDQGDDGAYAPRLPDVLLQGSGDIASLVLEGEEDPCVTSYAVVDVPGDRLGALELSASLDPRDARGVARIKRLTILLSTLLAVSAVTIFLLGVRLVGRPLAKLAAKTERVGRGDLSGPLELDGAAELSELALGLNRMCDDLSAARDRLQAETELKLQALDQLRHADRLRTVGRLASGIAHELGTPLNVVSGRAALIERGTMDSAAAIQSAAIIREQANRMTQIIRQLLDFARRRSSEKKPFNAERLSAYTCELIAPAARKQRVEIETSSRGEDPFMAIGNEPEIQQVLSNLVMNAIQAMPQGGKVVVEVSRARVKPPTAGFDGEASYVRFTVSDQGEGIEEEDLPLVFEPFFTTKDVGSGTGLGLSIVLGIVEDHSGWIEAESRVGQGSRFTFYLPEDDS